MNVRDRSESRGPFVVGKVEMTMDITVERALGAHHMWEATCEHIDLSALGRTPGEAVASLGAAMVDRGLVQVMDVDVKTVNACVEGR